MREGMPQVQQGTAIIRLLLAFIVPDHGGLERAGTQDGLGLDGTVAIHQRRAVRLAPIEERRIADQPGLGDFRIAGTQFPRRADDTAETVTNRLMAYYRETSPLVGYYFCKGTLQAVDGMAPIEQVSKEIETVLAKL